MFGLALCYEKKEIGIGKCLAHIGGFSVFVELSTWIIALDIYKLQIVALDKKIQFPRDSVSWRFTSAEFRVGTPHLGSRPTVQKLIHPSLWMEACIETSKAPRDTQVRQAEVEWEPRTEPLGDCKRDHGKQWCQLNVNRVSDPTDCCHLEVLGPPGLS